MPVYLENDGIQWRQNAVDEPSNPDGTWLVALHGGYGNPFGFRITDKLYESFPNSHILHGSANDSKLWDYKNTTLDVDYLESMCNKFVALYDLNYSDGFVIGVSQGAMMALRLANRLPFNCVVSVSGTYNSPEAFTYGGKVLMVNSLQDRVIPYAGNINNTSVVDTVIEAKKTATVQEIKIDSQYSNDAFYHHTWGEIEALHTSLKQDIIDFIK